MFENCEDGDKIETYKLQRNFFENDEPKQSSDNDIQNEQSDERDKAVDCENYVKNDGRHSFKEFPVDTTLLNKQLQSFPDW